MENLSRIIWVAPKSNHMYPHERKVKGDFMTRTQKRRQRLEWWGHNPRNANDYQQVIQCHPTNTLISDLCPQQQWDN
jgi:hypothetical protein